MSNRTDNRTAEAQGQPTPIGDLLADYEANGCDFTDLAWVRAAARGYVKTMPDSQVRCLLHVLAQHPAEYERQQPCGCVLCVCEDEKQCHGCGAKHCGNRTDHPAYVTQQPAAVEEYTRANVAHATAALNAKIEALRAEVERLRQLVNGGRGPLPAGAVAWLDMSPGEASLAFDKKSDSNRANKRRVMELFHRVSAGYYPLYLEPQADRAERLAEALRLAIRQNSHDMLMTGDELRQCEAALHHTAAQEKGDG